MAVGGQAVIEGVLIRKDNDIAIAVRKKGKIAIKKEKAWKKNWFTKLLFIRGFFNLLEMVVIGLRSLSWSANQQLGKKDEMTNRELVGVVFTSFIFAILLFVIAPFYITKFVGVDGEITFNIVDGIFRVMIFLAYLLIIAQMKDVKTLFMYHGAEHKTIACYEAGKKLEVETIRKFAKEHRRCGTAFVLIVLIVSIFVFSFVTGSWAVKLLARVVLLPVIAGISYEILKLIDKMEHTFLGHILAYPGLLMQKITTIEPNDKQIEVAIAAMKAVSRNANV